MKKSTLIFVICLSVSVQSFSQGFANFSTSFVPRKHIESPESVFESSNPNSFFSHVTATYGGGYTTKFKKQSVLSLTTYEGIIYRPFSPAKEIPFFAQARISKGFKVNVHTIKRFDVINVVLGYSLTNQPSNQEKVVGHGITAGVNYVSRVNKIFKIRYDLTYSNHYITPSVGVLVSWNKY